MSRDGGNGPEDHGWTEREREWMARLPAEQAPPPELRGRVVDALVRQGSIRGREDRARRGRSRRLLAAAAIVLAFLTGGLLGRATAPPGLSSPAPEAGPEAAPRVPGATPGGSRYLLLLYEDSPNASDPATERERVREYAAWARALTDPAALVLGEKLEAGPQAAVPADSEGPDEGDTLSGFFIIEARDYEAALDIARESPHVAHGGTVVVRVIEPT